MSQEDFTLSINIQVERPNVIWRQVAEQMREKILSGDLPPGTKLPSTAALAQQSGTDVKTVHRALTDLVKEGLITRTRKVGTYVTDRHTELTRIGIYHASDILAKQSSLFLQALHSELHKLAHKKNISTRVFVDQRPTARQTTAWPELEKAARDKEIQGVVSSIADLHHLPWLKKIKVPVAFMGGHEPGSVFWDHEAFVDLSFRAAKERGCREIAIITPFRPSYTQFLKTVHEKAQAYDCLVKPEWIIRPEEDAVLSDNEYEKYGYEAFQQLWSLKEKPKAVIAYPDLLTRGVLLGIMERQVRVPEDLLPIFHRNEGIDYFCPLPVLYIQSQVSLCAKALLNKLSLAFHGKTPSPEILGFSVDDSELK